MDELAHMQRWMHIPLYNGALVCPQWDPSGYVDVSEHSACIYLYKKDCKSNEISCSGTTSHQWRAGEVGFHPSNSANQVDYTISGALIEYVALPDALIEQAVPLGELRIFRHKNDQLAAHLIRSASNMKVGEDPLLVDSIIIAMVHRIAQWHRGTEPIPIRKNDHQIKRSVEYLNDNLVEPITLKELASVACMSEFHFARQFHGVTGRSPHAYMVHKRIERAKVMLCTGPESVATIAYACGFGSQAHFSKQFRAQQGMSPTAYRQAARTSSAPTFE